VIEGLNPHTLELARAVEGLTDIDADAAAIDRLRDAAAAATTAAAALQLELDDEKLRADVDAYATELAAMAEVTDALAQARTRADHRALHDAVVRADGIVTAADDALARIDGYCAAP
jgi:hypothetical protein